MLQMLNPTSLLSYHFTSRRVRGFHQIFKRSVLLRKVQDPVSWHIHSAGKILSFLMACK